MGVGQRCGGNCNGYPARFSVVEVASWRQDGMLVCANTPTRHVRSMRYDRLAAEDLLVPGHAKDFDGEVR